jgi:photosystem II stability/assembly factor-like uncharacterized protein
MPVNPCGKESNLFLMYRVLLLILLFYSHSLSAQWEVKNVSEEYRTINVLKFYNDETGYAMGTDGLVLKSTDSGESWEAIETDVIGDITDFNFISSDTLLLCSTLYDGEEFERRIYKTVNGGELWEEKRLGEGDFGCIQFLNVQEGICSGFSNILKTNNGGESWVSVFNVADHDFDFGSVDRFDMVNDSVGYAVGTGLNNNGVSLYSFILKTADRGESWEIINEYGKFVEDIDFLDEEEGFIADDNYTYHTIDSGLTWDTLSNIYGVVDFSTPSADQIYTVNRPAAYIPGSVTSFAISKSSDGGLSWEGEYSDGAHLETVFFLSDSVGFVAGDYSIIMKTESGGGEITGDYPWHLFINSAKELQSDPLILFPNPASNNLWIGGFENLSAWQYAIHSIEGKQLLNGQLNTNEIDVSILPKGSFIIMATHENKIRIGRFTKVNN